MSHTPRLASGSVFKRYLNAKRPASGPTDPFFANVILLSPFDGTGSASFADLSPLNNTISLLSSGVGAMTISQNGTVPLFGKNTLRIDRPGGDLEGKWLYVQQDANAINPATDSIVIEYWLWQDLNSLFTSTPLQFQFKPATLGVPQGNAIFEADTTAPGLVMQFRNALTFGAAVAFSASNWHYIAMQYKASNATAYCYIDGVLQYSIANATVASAGWIFYIGGFGGNSLGNAFRLNIANMRITKALRYDATPTIPIPTAPWPTS